MLNFYSREIECNSGVKQFITEIAAAVETLATENAEKFGYGRAALLDAGGFWVLHKLKFKICDYPEKVCTLIAETWPLPTKRIKVERNYVLKTADEKMSVLAVSEWCVLNSATRKPMAVNNDILSNGCEYLNRQINIGAFTKITSAVTDGEFCYERKIIEEDIDDNCHTNNKKYTEMVLNCFSDDFFAENSPKAYELHFVKETVKGDIIKIYKKHCDNTVTVTGENCGNTVFNAIIEF